MSIYFTTVAPGATATAFTERGLSGRSATRVNEAPIHVFPKSPVASSLLIMVNLLHEYASATGNATTMKADMKNLFRPLVPAPVAPPTCIVSIEGMGEAAELKDLGFEDDTSIRMGGKWMIGHGITPQKLGALWKTGADLKGAALSGNVNPCGLLAFYYAWMGVGIYARGCGGRVEEHAEVSFVLKERDPKDIGTVDDGVEEIGGTRRQNLDHYVGGKKTMGTEKIATTSDLTPVIVRVDTPHDKNAFTWNITDAIAGEGFLFEYFEGMLLGGGSFVADVFLRYFSRCISDTYDGLAGIVPNLRRGFTSLSSSEQGRQLQHIYFGISASIETGSKLRILLDRGVYRGFVLQGDNALVLIDGVVRKPMDEAALQEAIRMLDVHSRNVEKIVELCGMVVIKGSNTKTIPDVDRMKNSSRYFAEEVYRRVWSEEQKTLIDTYVKDLRFGSTYWEPTKENVIKVFEHIQSGTIDISEPFYCGDELIWSDDKIRRILTVFGPQAPVLSVRSGTISFTMASPGAEDPNLRTDAEGKRPLPYLPIYLRNVSDAADMWDTIRRTHAFKMIPARRKGAGKVFDRKKDVGHIGGDEFVDFYSRLKAWSYARSGKRRAESRPDDEPDRAKKAATDATKRASEASMFM